MITAEDIMKKYGSKKATVCTDAWGSIGEMFNDEDVEAMINEFTKYHIGRFVISCGILDYGDKIKNEVVSKMDDYILNNIK